MKKICESPHEFYLTLSDEKIEIKIPLISNQRMNVLTCLPIKKKITA